MSRPRAGSLAAAILCGLGLSACAPGADTPDAGAFDGGTFDAGAGPTPQPFPLAILDDARLGTSFTAEFQGVVKLHEPATEWPDNFGERQPARVLAIDDVGGTRRKLYYSLPDGFGIRLNPGTPVRLFYKELAAASDTSSHGVRLTTPTGTLLAIFEDGLAGPAFTDAERFGIGFTLDELALDESEDPCGRRVRYPLVVTVAGTSRRMDPGAARDFELTGGLSVTLTLLDAFRLEDNICGAVPPFSLAWIARPATP